MVGWMAKRRGEEVRRERRVLLVRGVEDSWVASLEHLVVEVGAVLVLYNLPGLEVQRLEVQVPDGEDHLRIQGSGRHSGGPSAPTPKSRKGGNEWWK